MCGTIAEFTEAVLITQNIDGKIPFDFFKLYFKVVQHYNFDPRDTLYYELLCGTIAEFTEAVLITQNIDGKIPFDFFKLYFKVVQHYNFDPRISIILTTLHWHVIVSKIPALYW